jgi:hypothetical protein
MVISILDTSFDPSQWHIFIWEGNYKATLVIEGLPGGLMVTRTASNTEALTVVLRYGAVKLSLAGSALLMSVSGGALVMTLFVIGDSGF